MPSKGEVAAARARRAARERASAGLAVAVAQALEAGLTAEQVARALCGGLRKAGLLRTADEILAAVRRCAGEP